MYTHRLRRSVNCGFSLCEKGQNRDDNFPQILLASYDSYTETITEIMIIFNADIFPLLFNR